MIAEELRIGNYISFMEDGSLSMIESIDRSGFNVSIRDEITWIEEDQFEPIPLTQEWLSRFGFEKDNLTFKEVEYFINYISIRKHEHCFRLICNDGSICPDIKYVHQLQNLYFALTGEELKLK